MARDAHTIFDRWRGEIGGESLILGKEASSPMCCNGGMLISWLSVAHIHLAPCALENLRRIMELRRRCMQEHVLNSLQKMTQISEYRSPFRHHRNRVLTRSLETPSETWLMVMPALTFQG